MWISKTGVVSKRWWSGGESRIIASPKVTTCGFAIAPSPFERQKQVAGETALAAIVARAL
jgi:hypothetical protein